MGDVIGFLIPAWLKRALWGAVAGLVALLAVWGAGRREGRQRAKLDAAKRYTETRRAMDEADIIGDQPRLSREWLRERGKR